MALSENEFIIKRVMDDCSVVSEQLSRILENPELSSKVTLDLAACVDTQNQMLRNIILLVSPLFTETNPWEFSRFESPEEL